jgi:hypothetical protein
MLGIRPSMRGPFGPLRDSQGSQDRRPSIRTATESMQSPGLVGVDTGVFGVRASASAAIASDTTTAWSRAPADARALDLDDG